MNKPTNKPPDTSGPRLTAKMEHYCQRFTTGSTIGDKSASYREAYAVGPDTLQNTVNTKAWELHQHPLVSERIRELTQARDTDNAVTVHSLCKELETDRQLANSLDKPNPAFTLGKARLHGLGDNRQTDAASVLNALAGLVQQLDARNEPPPMPEPPAISSTCERIEE